MRVKSNFRNPQLYTQIWNMTIVAKWSSWNVLLKNLWQHRFFFFAGVVRPFGRSWRIWYPAPGGGPEILRGFPSDFLRFYTVFCFTYFLLISQKEETVSDHRSCRDSGKKKQGRSRRRTIQKKLYILNWNTAFFNRRWEFSICWYPQNLHIYYFFFQNHHLS